MRRTTFLLVLAAVLALGAPSLRAQADQCYSQYPAGYSETENFPDSQATVTINDVSYDVYGPFSMKVTGPATVLPDGRCQLNVQMVALNMQGSGLSVTLDGSSPSPGAVTQQTAGTDFPADSVINVNAVGNAGGGPFPINARMTSLGIRGIPPPVATTYADIMCRIHKITTCPNIVRCTTAPGPDGIVRETCLEEICAVAAGADEKTTQ